MIYSGLTESQLSGMGTALTQGGTGLLHIAIQIMPYAIAFTIILIIFGLIKNWSKLKNGFSKPKYVNKFNVNDPFDRDYYDDDVNELIESINYSDSQSGYTGHKGSYKRKGNKVYWKWHKGSNLDDVLVIDDIYDQEGYNSLDRIYNNSSDYYDKWLKKRSKRK